MNLNKQDYSMQLIYLENIKNVCVTAKMPATNEHHLSEDSHTVSKSIETIFLLLLL